MVGVCCMSVQGGTHGGFIDSTQSKYAQHGVFDEIIGAGGAGSDADGHRTITGQLGGVAFLLGFEVKIKMDDLLQ